MTVEQLDLTGGSRIVGLTERQDAALKEIERLGGVRLDELGAYMHGRRCRHHEDSRCDYCSDEGAAVMNELYRKALVERRHNGVWASTRALEEAGEQPGSLAGASAVPVQLPASSSAPAARANDPDTSHQAAASVTDLNGKQHAVLQAFERYGAMTDEDLTEAYDLTGGPEQSDSGLRTRRHELVEQGLVRNSGRQGQTASGRAAIVWEIVPESERGGDLAFGAWVESLPS